MLRKNFDLTSPGEAIRLRDLEGPFLADADSAIEIRLRLLEPALMAPDATIEVDFSGVDLASSSWINAFLGGALLDHGQGILKRITFRGCNRAIQASIRLAVNAYQARMKKNDPKRWTKPRTATDPSPA